MHTLYISLTTRPALMVLLIQPEEITPRPLLLHPTIILNFDTKEIRSDAVDSSSSLSTLRSDRSIRHVFE